MRTLVALGFAVAMAAQNVPTVMNGQVEVRAFSGDLAAQLKSENAAWFGYQITTPRKSNNWCNGQNQNPIHLEGTDQAAVLLRIEHNEIGEVRLYSMECEFDVGGLPFVWLTGVSTHASLEYLKTLPTDKSVFLISQHTGDEALQILIDDAKNSASTHTKEQALFWLAQRAGSKAAATIVDAITNDPNTEVKEKQSSRFLNCRGTKEFRS